MTLGQITLIIMILERQGSRNQSSDIRWHQYFMIGSGLWDLLNRIFRIFPQKPPVKSTPDPKPMPNNTIPTPPSEEVIATNDRDRLPLYSPEQIDLEKFNALKSPDDRDGKPIKNMRQLFNKEVILDDETTLNVETIKIPGFMGISDELEVTDPKDKIVSAHEDIVKYLQEYGLLICTYQYNKDQYGTPIDLRSPWAPDDNWLFMETFLKNEGHHAGAIVPARRLDKINYQLIDSFASFNEPDEYHNGMFGAEGFVAVAQRLVFPEFVTKEQARGYTNTIINWMALLNPFAQFADNDFNGGDPTRVVDRDSLQELLKNGLLASIGFPEALEFFNKSENKLYCAEFIFVTLNAAVYPFNKATITKLLDGDSDLATEVLALRNKQNSRKVNFLSEQTTNSEFKAMNIPMPIVPEDLPPLDVLMTNNGQTIDPKSIPFPPFQLSHLIRRAFRTLLPRHQYTDLKLAEAQARLFSWMEPLFIKQLRLDEVPADDLKLVGLRDFMNVVKQQLAAPITDYTEFDKKIDLLMQKADEMLVGAGDLIYFIPPRIYVDLGQNDGDNNLPKGWGFSLETIGALISRSVINS